VRYKLNADFGEVIV